MVVEEQAMARRDGRRAVSELGLTLRASSVEFLESGRLESLRGAGVS